ncbi:NADPH-dependent F420 reductase [Streptomyces sp. IMTB 2501]|uniref:NADPH-dependent F420 reductase n=1 Tax=Streptomyces sp. IMTB 2501 TaxID=1776340 RepID=UPI00273E0825|nr:NAD(P)-binding domain-containing protein [Streptomyces sp. IMTB 2501]
MSEPDSCPGRAVSAPSPLPACTAVVGCGRMGSALLRAALWQGLEVLAGVREHRRRRPGVPPEVVQLAPGRAAAAAELVVLAVPPGEPLRQLAEQLEPVLAGKVVLELSNPVMPQRDMPAPRGPWGPSEAELLARRLPRTRVAKALNTVSAKALGRLGPVPSGEWRRPSVPVAVDDPSAQRLVCAWVEALGFEAVPAGPLTHARWLEHLAQLLCHIDAQSGRTGLVGCRILRP